MQRCDILPTLSRALKRERVGGHREAMGRVRVWQAPDLDDPHPSSPLRGTDSLSRFKAREREGEKARNSGK